ncbi:hypothetical protein TNCV_2377971 [Trichonephila clavipes]|nr:hypothetical protein TNCV_2377971 [Trichonephila clavipes]
MDLEILNYGQVTMMTPQMAPPLHGRSSAALGPNSQHAGCKFVTLTTRLQRPTRTWITKNKVNMYSNESSKKLPIGR